MTGRFESGVSANIHCRAHKLKHLRVKAGPQRDRYVHDIVFQAKILGRREAWEREHPDQPVPNDDFYRYLEPIWETIDHQNQNSLDNDPGNLVRMSRADHAVKTVAATTEKRRIARELKAARAAKRKEMRKAKQDQSEAPF